MALPGSPIAEDLLLRAGLQGDGLAAFAVMRRQTLSGRTLATERVFEQWRAGIARIGHPLVGQIASVVAPPGATPARPGPAIDWDRIAEALARPPGLDIAAPAALSDKPFIRRFDNALLTVEECEYLIGMSARLLAPAGVVDKTSGTTEAQLGSDKQRRGVLAGSPGFGGSRDQSASCGGCRFGCGQWRDDQRADVPAG